MEVAKTIRNHPEGITNIHDQLHGSVSVGGRQTHMLSFPAVKATKSAFIEPTLYCSIDFFFKPVDRNEGCRQLDGLKTRCLLTL